MDAIEGESALPGDAGGVTRRCFLGSVGAVAATTALGAAGGPASGEAQVPNGVETRMGIADGPGSQLFQTIPLAGNTTFEELAGAPLSDALRRNVAKAPSGQCVCWGIPFSVERLALSIDKPVEMAWPAILSPWLVFLHTTDVGYPPANAQGFFEAPKGHGLLREHVADYVLRYADGTEARVEIRGRHQVGMVQRMWGQNCFEAVAHIKPHPVRTLTEQPRNQGTWGWTQCRVSQPDGGDWVDWLWAWENPRPGEALVGLRIEPGGRPILLSAVTTGQVASHPLRWETRRKTILTLPAGAAFDPNLTGNGLLTHAQLDLGQVISAQPRTVYPNESWSESYCNQNPTVPPGELLVEYAAHPEASFHLADGSVVPAAAVTVTGGALRVVAPAERRVRLTVRDKATRKPVPVKLHLHGEAGEFLAPVDRNRIANTGWYEDLSVDYVNPPYHACTYITGETTVDLPLGRVYVEVSKGFEIRPVRTVLEVGPETRELTVELERVLPWRERGWVSADTHVHFLSPPSAHLEGAGEGVNVVNLLASQWGELMTNVGDFDGRTTFGSREAGGDGEHLVRVGTENRQHVLGHISLLGYEGGIISPMCSGGPDESALGDPLEVLLTEWARQCRSQGGVVVLPHFPHPRAEHAAAIVSGDVDAVEMTSWSNLYGGIDPYSLSDWYRYLNCGYFVAAVGGTDKMAASTAVGAVRTYAMLPPDREFGYDTWKDAIRSGETFATYGPLMEFTVEGKPPGQWIKMGASGGTVSVEWKLASVTVPMSRVDVVVNGEVRESRTIGPWDAEGSASVRVERGSWVALLVRGHYPDKPEIIAAHSSPVMIEVESKPFSAAADALTILDQIEGSLAYLDTIGTRADDEAYRRMRMVLTGAYRSVHNRMHQMGEFHAHTVATDHSEHH